MEKTQDLRRSRELFSHPFNRKYWKTAAFELTNWRTLVFAALIIAMRIVIKSIKITIIPGVLNFGFDFIVNSVGSMIYGPIVALLVGAVSDTIGAILFPTGVYFFPFIIVEMLSGFIFGIFLYRSKLSTWRVVFSRLSVIVFCNLIVNPLIMTWYYAFFGKGTYTPLILATLIKNIALLPAESIVLVFWLGAISFATYQLGLTYAKPEKLQVKARHIISLLLAVLLSIGAIFGYRAYNDYKNDPYNNKESVELRKNSNLPDNLGTYRDKLKTELTFETFDDTITEKAYSEALGLEYTLSTYELQLSSDDSTKLRLIGIALTAKTEENGDLSILGIKLGDSITDAKATLEGYGYNFFVDQTSGSKVYRSAKGILEITIYADEDENITSIVVLTQRTEKGITKINSTKKSKLPLKLGINSIQALSSDIDITTVAFNSECFPGEVDMEVVTVMTFTSDVFNVLGVSPGMEVEEANTKFTAEKLIKISDTEYSYGLVRVLLSVNDGIIDSITIKLTK